jgi:hypothetical protein
MPTLQSAQDLPEGILAVLYDKNKMEASGYAAVLADLTGETVMLVPFYDNEENPRARFTDDGVLEVRIGKEFVFILVFLCLLFIPLQRAWGCCGKGFTWCKWLVLWCFIKCNHVLWSKWRMVMLLFL